MEFILYKYIHIYLRNIRMTSATNEMNTKVKKSEYKIIDPISVAKCLYSNFFKLLERLRKIYI